MVKTYKGWTRTARDLKSVDTYFTKWTRDGYPTITDYMDGTSKGWCDPEDRYQVDIPNGKPYERSVYRSFKRLSDAILYAETGTYAIHTSTGTYRW